MQIKFPLDSDGFMRRHCSACNKEFKCKVVAASDELGPPQEKPSYHCPYCNHQAGPDDWWTPAQLDHAQANALNFASEKLFKPFKDLERTSQRHGGGAISITFKASVPSHPKPAPMVEADDMTPHVPGCHPDEPIKVQPALLLHGKVHCVVCGANGHLAAG